MGNVSRFHLHACTCTVEAFLWRIRNENCDKCYCEAAQNEVNVPFCCKDLFVYSL